MGISRRSSGCQVPSLVPEWQDGFATPKADNLLLGRAIEAWAASNRARGRDRLRYAAAKQACCGELSADLDTPYGALWVRGVLFRLGIKSASELKDTVLGLSPRKVAPWTGTRSHDAD